MMNKYYCDHLAILIIVTVDSNAILIKLAEATSVCVIVLLYQYTYGSCDIMEEPFLLQPSPCIAQQGSCFSFQSFIAVCLVCKTKAILSTD